MPHFHSGRRASGLIMLLLTISTAQLNFDAKSWSPQSLSLSLVDVYPYILNVEHLACMISFPVDIASTVLHEKWTRLISRLANLVSMTTDCGLEDR